MPELEHITIKGFKSIASIEKLKLGAINIIIGPNGSGKSNLIGAFSFLHAIREGRLQEYVKLAGGAERLLHYGSKNTDSITFDLSFEDEINQYRIELSPGDGDQLYPNKETAYYWNKDYPSAMGKSLASHGNEAGISNPRVPGIGSYVRDHLGRWRVYHFHDTGNSSPMKKYSDINDNRFLRFDASNLAPFLYLLRERHEASYYAIEDTIRLVAPFFESFQLEPQQLNPNNILLEWRHKGSDAYYNASSFSDGTLRFIALATLFLQPEMLRPSVILVDEPELGLHPFAITMLASLIKQASKQTQVIVSTQSPLLLDHFAPEDVLVADRVDGGTQVNRLDSVKLASWLEEYSLGQLWEKNELGGRPRPE